MKRGILQRKFYKLKVRKPLKRGTKRIAKASKLTPAKLKKKLDILFSLYIRNRDKKCAYPGCTYDKRFECSHFYNRSKLSVRFDPDNCITLCSFHHWGSPQLGWEYEKQSDYRDYMLTKLGPERYEALRVRAKTPRPISIKEYEHLIEVLKTRPQDYESEYYKLLNQL